MPLITTIAEVKQVLRVSNIDGDDGIPDMLQAEEVHIIPAIGQEQYDALVAAYEVNTLTPEQQSLLLKIQKPLAAFAYHDDLSLQHAIITSAGIRRTTTDNMPTAFRWEFDGVKEALVNRAYIGMESLLKFLDDNIDDYPLYSASEAYTRRNKYLIRSGADFADQYRVYQPSRTFNSIMTMMDDVESLYVIPILGEYFTTLKGLASPTTEEKLVIADLKKAIAHLTIFHAVQKFSVRITEHGLTIYSGNTDRSDSDRAQPTDNLLSMTIKACERDGQNYLTKAKKYLNDNASETVFADFYNSDSYSAPSEPVDPNTDRAFYTFIR